jgi:glycosyl transferase family 25
MKSISDIEHAFYINLDKRPDRKQHVETQLGMLGINAERFSAIQMDNGAIGCSMSHIKLLEMARDNEWDHILIVEDDILFTEPDIFKNQLNLFFNTVPEFDVLLLGGNNMSTYKKVNPSCVQIKNCQTTTGYLVKCHYYDTLITNFREGLAKLLREPFNHSLYAIDKYWFELQERDRWYLIVPLTVTQREDYSNIEKKRINYTSLMLDLDKTEMMERIKILEILYKIQNMHEKGRYYYL